MEILTDIPFTLDTGTLMKKVRIEPGSDDADLFETLVGTARDIGKPKAIYTESFIEARDGDTVTVDSVTFVSRTLRMNLEGIGRVFPFLVTCGREADGVDLPAGEFLAPYWWDAIKEALLGAAISSISTVGSFSAMHPR